LSEQNQEVIWIPLSIQQTIKSLGLSDVSARCTFLFQKDAATITTDLP